MSLYLGFLPQKWKVLIKELKCRYPKFAVKNIYQNAKKFPPDRIQVDDRKFNEARPCKMIDIDEIMLLRTILRLRILQELFTVKMQQIEIGLLHIST